MPALAFFDFCGTLVALQSTPAFVSFMSQTDSRMALRWAFLRLLRSACLISPSDFRRRKLGLLTGFKRSLLEEAGQRFAQTILLPRLLPSVLERWCNHQRSGATCAIVSRALDVFLEPLAIQLKPTALICCQLAYDSGICLGRLRGPDLTGDAKAAVVRPLLAGTRNSDTYAYTDSAADAPLLRLVRHRYVVAPVMPGWAKQLGCHLIRV